MYCPTIRVASHNGKDVEIVNSSKIIQIVQNLRIEYCIDDTDLFSLCAVVKRIDIRVILHRTLRDAVHVVLKMHRIFPTVLVLPLLPLAARAHYDYRERHEHNAPDNAASDDVRQRALIRVNYNVWRLHSWLGGCGCGRWRGRRW